MTDEAATPEEDVLTRLNKLEENTRALGESMVEVSKTMHEAVHELRAVVTHLRTIPADVDE